MKEGKGMENLKVNEENYEAYQQLMDIRNNNVKTKNGKILPGVLLGIAGWFLSTCYVGSLSGKIFTLILDDVINGRVPVMLATFLQSFFFSLEAAYMFLAAHLACDIPEIVEEIRTKRLHKKHPNIDITVNVKELGKSLKQYQLSKASKDIEKKQERFLANQNESSREMTPEENLAFLKQEREFWEQVSIQEKYQDASEDTAGQMGIGQVESSKEDKNKVYHI